MMKVVIHLARDREVICLGDQLFADVFKNLRSDEGYKWLDSSSLKNQIKAQEVYFFSSKCWRDDSSFLELIKKRESVVHLFGKKLQTFYFQTTNEWKVQQPVKLKFHQEQYSQTQFFVIEGLSFQHDQLMDTLKILRGELA